MSFRVGWATVKRTVARRPAEGPALPVGEMSLLWIARLLPGIPNQDDLMRFLCPLAALFRFFPGRFLSLAIQRTPCVLLNLFTCVRFKGKP